MRADMTRYLKSSTFAAVFIAVINLTGTAKAEDDKKNLWIGNIDVNALFTSGNSSQTSIGIAGKATYKIGAAGHTVSGFADFNKSSGITDRERYGVGYNFAYDLSSRTFFTLDSSYENNQFGAFRERFVVAAGAGYRMKDTAQLKWTLEAAPSTVFTREIEGADFTSDFSAFIRSNIEWVITDTTKFTNTTSAYFGGRSILEAKSAFEFRILESINSKISYDILYDKDAPLGRKATDTVARVGLSYGF